MKAKKAFVHELLGKPKKDIIFFSGRTTKRGEGVRGDPLRFFFNW